MTKVTEKEGLFGRSMQIAQRGSSVPQRALVLQWRQAMNRFAVVGVVTFLLLSPTPVFAQDEQVYEDGIIRIVAKKVESTGRTSFNVCAWVVGDKPVGLVTVDLVFKDSFDKPIVVSEVLLLWDEGAQALCNTWPLPAQAQNFWKWETRNVVGFECRERKLTVIHSTNPSEEISARNLEELQQHVERLKRSSRISSGLLERIKGCW